MIHTKLKYIILHIFQCFTILKYTSLFTIKNYISINIRICYIHLTNVQYGRSNVVFFILTLSELFQYLT